MSEENAPAFRRNDARRSPPVNNYNIIINKEYTNEYGTSYYLKEQCRMYGKVVYKYNPKFKTMFISLDEDNIIELSEIVAKLEKQLGFKIEFLKSPKFDVKGINLKIQQDFSLTVLDVDDEFIDNFRLSVFKRRGASQGILTVRTGMN